MPLGTLPYLKIAKPHSERPGMAVRGLQGRVLGQYFVRIWQYNHLRGVIRENRVNMGLLWFPFRVFPGVFRAFSALYIGSGFIVCAVFT